ncbi:MAG: hydroxymethylglutaryl-CoA lyase [Noviherbaspirillum sp.]|nr:hydroxymethylglutaryl-CoA lyase [Noviherbaspirillum sp.]
MALPSRVKIVEVGPRDGLQNEQETIPAAVKIGLIDRLTDAGFVNIEAASFVSPKWVPQMATSAEVMAGIRRKPGVVYSALVPNLKGFDAALAAKADEVVIFGAASEAFSQRNINCSIAESIERFREVAQAAKANGLRLRGAVSCALGCPYQGEVSPESAADVVRRLRDLGCDEIDIADTIGVATPRKVQATIERAAREFPIERLSGHFHDTYGQAMANIYASLEVGITIFHSSVAGLGGCPYAKGATGNVSTEDVLYMMDGLGIDTGIDLNAVVDAGLYISEHLGRKPVSRAGNALLAKRQA